MRAVVPPPGVIGCRWLRGSTRHQRQSLGPLPAVLATIGLAAAFLCVVRIYHISTTSCRAGRPLRVYRLSVAGLATTASARGSGCCSYHPPRRRLVDARMHCASAQVTASLLAHTNPLLSDRPLSSHATTTSYWDILSKPQKPSKSFVKFNPVTPVVHLAAYILYSLLIATFSYLSFSSKSIIPSQISSQALTQPVQHELGLAHSRHHRAVLANPIPLHQSLFLLFSLFLLPPFRREPYEFGKLYPLLVAVPLRPHPVHVRFKVVGHVADGLGQPPREPSIRFRLRILRCEGRYRWGSGSTGGRRIRSIAIVVVMIIVIIRVGIC